jgi:hypothetical protein
MNAAVAVIGDRWSPLVPRDVMFSNWRHFCVLQHQRRLGPRLRHPGQ